MASAERASVRSFHAVAYVATPPAAISSIVLAASSRREVPAELEVSIGFTRSASFPLPTK
jgi:hypothetical protein